MTPEKLRVAREKLTRVFRYLEALNQHRNPAKRQIREQLWSFWLHDLPDQIRSRKKQTRGVSEWRHRLQRILSEGAAPGAQFST